MYTEEDTSCCGISYLHYFPSRVTEQTLAAFNRQFEDFTKAPVNRLVACSLTDTQMKVWAPELQKRGFRLVTRFKNSNSGNYVNVLHYTRLKRCRKKRPFEWKAGKGE